MGWFALLSLVIAQEAPMETADAVFKNGNFYTVTRSRAEALAVRGDRVLAVGSWADVEKHVGRETRIVDLQGRTVTPGLIDGHGHVASLGSLLTGRLDLRETRSYDELLKAVKAKVASSKAGEWILGGRWDQANWGQDEFPHHAKLSEISPENPVLLRRIDGHAALANRKAMERAGITRETPNPKGGEILRDDRGEPTGIFVDNAIDLFEVRGGGSLRELVLAAQTKCLSVGLTGVHDAGITLAEADLYRELCDQEKLKFRVYAMIAGEERLIPWFEKNKPTVGYGGNRFTLRSCKLMIDGAMGSRGAWLLADYSDRPGHAGLPVTSPDAIRRIAAAARKNGYQVCTHAIGDRGIRETLDAYQSVSARKDDRFRIEHAQCPAVEDIPRFAKLGVLPSMQPTHATSDMRWAEARVGPERIRGAYAWAQFLRAGSRIVGGSDFPVESENPLLGVYAAVTRQDREGKPEGGWRTMDLLTREEALRAFTIDAAYGAFEEDLKGSLEVGKLADFVVWSKDVMTCPAKELLHAEVVLTVVGGEVVYERK